VRIAFFGTGAVSAAYLSLLLERGEQVSLVVTKEPRRRGRRGAPEPTPVEMIAAERGVPVRYHPREVDPDSFDLGVVVAYGRILPGWLVEARPLVNVHYSLLPAWRGAAPVQRAILAGATKSGVTLMRLVEELDAGPIIEQVEVDIAGLGLDDVLARCTEAGCAMLSRWLEAPAGWWDAGRPQVGEPTFAPRLDAEEYRIRLAEPAERGVCRVRLGRAWLLHGGRRVQVLAAHAVEGDGSEPLGTVVDGGIRTARGLLVPELVRPEGGRAMTFGAYANRFGGTLAPFASFDGSLDREES
jgi:methionyl-tRNA formyltransferase